MERRATNNAIADPEAPASSMASSNDEGDVKDGKFAGLCTCFTATRLALALSFSTLVIGCVLFIISSQKNGPRDAVPEPTLLDRNATEAYWLRVQNEVLLPSQQQALIPDSSVWKALLWMAVNDPLRPVPSGWQTTQRYVMIALFYHWSGGSGWDLQADDGWIQPQHLTTSGKEHECAWTGVECNSDKQVTSLFFDAEPTTFVLHGQIPSEIGLLTSLELLDVSGHSLKGVLPTELANLAPSLKSLSASANRLTSLDADLLGQLTSLEVLHLSENLLRGELPTTLVNLAKLLVLDVANNDALTGNALAMMNAWPNLQELDVTNTRIRGSLPDGIGGLSHLEFLGLGFSHIAGTIPTSIGKCTALTAISIASPRGVGNGLNGTIPTELGRLTNLALLSLSGNPNLDSTIPATAIGAMTSLRSLDLSENDQMHGTLPTQLGLLTFLQHLDISQTSLTGTLPTQVVSLTNLETLYIHGTTIHGTVPVDLCQLSSLQGGLVASCTSEQPQLDDCSCCVCVGL